MTFAVLLTLWSTLLLAQANSAAQPTCLPTFTPIAANRSLPHAYVDQGLQSLPRIYPSHVLMVERRSSSTGSVQYSLLVYKKDRAIERVTIEGVAVHGERAWQFSSTCPTERSTDGVVTTLERVAALAREDPDQRGGIEIVPAPDLRVLPGSAVRQNMMGFFDNRRRTPVSVDPSLRRCVRGTPPTTLSDILGPRAARIVVQQHASEWPNLSSVATYIRRLLTAPSENGTWSTFQVWSEGTDVEIDAWVESSAGPRRPLELGNGYAHAMDASGCEWWARYLGPNRGTWIVR